MNRRLTIACILTGAAFGIAVPEQPRSAIAAAFAVAAVIAGWRDQ